MMRIHNIRIISTSHIAEQSVEDIKKAFRKEKPDIVALELDAKRLHALMYEGETSQPVTLMARVGVLGYLFAVIGAYMQRRLGSIVGTKPGVEMLAGMEMARKHNAELYLIDQDVEVTLKRLSQSVGWEERINIVKELFTGILKREKLDIDLRKVPEKELVERLTEELRVKFPGIYKVLVTERNELMARRLESIARQNPDKQVLAVVGAGHSKGLGELLEKRLD